MHLKLKIRQLNLYLCFYFKIYCTNRFCHFWKCDNKPKLYIYIFELHITYILTEIKIFFYIIYLIKQTLSFILVLDLLNLIKFFIIIHQFNKLLILIVLLISIFHIKFLINIVVLGRIIVIVRVLLLILLCLCCWIITGLFELFKKIQTVLRIPIFFISVYFLNSIENHDYCHLLWIYSHFLKVFYVF